MPFAVPRRERGAWLADPAQPAARYRYLVEVEGRSPESAEARAERRQIPTRGWAAEILDEQDPRGFWKTRESLYRPKYVATNWRLLALADLGLTVRHPKVRRAVDLMLEDYGGSDGPFCRTGGEPHFCFVGNTARMMISFGLEEDRRVRASLDWLADQQLEDGGWDCFGRTKGTLDCWEAWPRTRRSVVGAGPASGSTRPNAGPSSTSSEGCCAKAVNAIHHGSGCTIRSITTTTSWSVWRRSPISDTGTIPRQSRRGSYSAGRCGTMEPGRWTPSIQTSLEGRTTTANRASGSSSNGSTRRASGSRCGPSTRSGTPRRRPRKRSGRGTGGRNRP